jgi:two-component system phosphate regulon response regulator PhoB
MAAKILVAEDEAHVAELIRYNLDAAGFKVVHAVDGDDVEALVEDERPDLLVLDWMLPGVSGIELCRRLRARAEFKVMPILMLTARGEEADKLRGLSVGADDYVVKPFSTAELVARVGALLRRSAPQQLAETLSAGDIVLERTSQRVLRAGRERRIGPTEYRMLEFMLTRAGRVLSRAQLLDGVWGRDGYVDERTVDVHIGRLRKALMRGDEADPIRTVRGAGYVIGGRD